MGEIQGFVTRTRGRTSEAMFGITSGTPPLSRNEMVATKRDGTIIGEFDSIGSAQRAVERSAGGQLLSWFRQDLNTDIEHWRGVSREFYPGDLNPGGGQNVSPAGGLLIDGLWFRADQGLRLGPQIGGAPTPQLVSRWASFDGSGNSASSPSVAERATYADATDILTSTGFPGLQFETGKHLTTTLASLEPPYSVFAAVSYSAAAASEIITTIGSFTNFSFSVSAAGDVQVRSDSNVGTAAVAIADGTTFVLSAVQHADTVDIFYNGVQGAGIPAVSTPVAGSPTISLVSDSWRDVIFELLVVPSDLNDNVVAKINRYFTDRYKPI